MPPPAKPRQFFIQGVTLDGKTFRPSDWSERLAGAMSSFRPEGGRGGIASYIGYSPYCEPMAWDFVMNFAKDNNLHIGEVCALPEPAKP